MFGLGKKDVTKCVVTFQHSSPTAADDFVGTFDIVFTGVGAAEYAAKWEEAKQAEIARTPEYIGIINNQTNFDRADISRYQKIADTSLPVKKKFFVSKREKEEEQKVLDEQRKAWREIERRQERTTRNQWVLNCLSRLGYETFNMASAADDFLSKEGFIRNRTKGDVCVPLEQLERCAGTISIHLTSNHHINKASELGGLGYGVCYSLYEKRA